MSKGTNNLKIAQAKVDRLSKELSSAKMGIAAAKALIKDEKAAEKAKKSMKRK